MRRYVAVKGVPANPEWRTMLIHGAKNTVRCTSESRKGEYATSTETGKKTGTVHDERVTAMDDEDESV